MMDSTPAGDGPRSQAGPAGRWIGVGLLFTFGLGIYSNFQLQGELFAAPGFLVRAAALPLHAGALIVMGLMTALVSLVVAAVLRGLYGAQYPLLSRCYFALVTAGVATALFEGSLFLAMRSLSEAFAAAGADPTVYAPAKALLAGLRDGAHYPDKLLGGISVTLMYLLLFRTRAIPRLLAGAGMLAGVLQIFAVGRTLFGMDTLYVLLAPLALVYTLTGLWLVVRGLAAPTIVHGKA